MSPRGQIFCWLITYLYLCEVDINSNEITKLGTKRYDKFKIQQNKITSCL